MRILLDPGHGGQWPGHASRFRGLIEKDLSLRVCEELAELLPPAWEVKFTRIADVHVSHRLRLRMAKEADLTLTIHWHSASSVYKKEVGAAARIYAGEQIARNILDRLAIETKEPKKYSPATGKIFHTEKPVVGLQLGLLSNRGTEADICERGRVERVSKCIVDGLVSHYSVGSSPAWAGTSVELMPATPNGQ